MANVTLRCADERLNELISKKFPGDVILGELGGVKWHMSRDGMEELFEQIEFAIDHKGTVAVNFVSHTDCGLYKELGEDSESHYTDDLTEAVLQIKERFPELQATGYLYDLETKELKKIA